MYARFVLAAGLLMSPMVGLAQDVEADVSVETNVHVNLGQTIKGDCAGMTGLKRVVCIRETKQKAQQSQARGKIVRGRMRAAEVHQQFKSRADKLKAVGAGVRKSSARKALEKIGGKVQKMTTEERRMLKGQMNVEKIETLKTREQLRRAKIESLRKRVHRR